MLILNLMAEISMVAGRERIPVVDSVLMLLAVDMLVGHIYIEIRGLLDSSLTK